MSVAPPLGPSSGLAWRPTATLATLRARAAILTSVRSFFAARGSLEVETPCVVPSPGLDAFLDAPTVALLGRPRYLATSPEYALKRLLCAGYGPVHQIGPAFRDDEVGRLHEPQFTLLEWYEPGADDGRCMDTTEALVRALADEHGGGWLTWAAGRTPAGVASPPYRRLTYRAAFALATGQDPHDLHPRALGRLLRAAGQRPTPDLTLDDLVDLVLGSVLPRALAEGGPTFVTDWPLDRAALARTRPGRDADGALTAGRFELYVGGVELCNGYHELADPREQRRRNEAENAARLARGRAPYPVDERLLAALEVGLPDCAGNALGLDRLVMLLLGATDLGAVRAFRVE